MNLKDLKKPFPAIDIEWRIGRCGEKNGKIWGKALAYITARAIHDRLDDVCGPGKWQNRYHDHLGGTICEIGIKVDDEWVWKAGGAEKTDFEAFKGGLSSAEKRAGVPWGIGRYLYNLDEAFIETSTSKKQDWRYQPENKKKHLPAFYWKTPPLPKWALPDGAPKEQPPATAAKQQPVDEPPNEPPNTEKPTDKPLGQKQGLAIMKIASELDSPLIEEKTKKVIDWYCTEHGRTKDSGDKLIKNFAVIFDDFLDGRSFEEGSAPPGHDDGKGADDNLGIPF